MNYSAYSLEDSKTEHIRTALSFLMFIETKLINKQPYQIASLDMSEIDGFSKYMIVFMPE